VNAPRPKASIFVVTRSRHEGLQRCLRALDDQTQDSATFEVVVVDAGSTSALAAAVEASEGRICIFVGDDVAAMPELVAAHLAGHETNEKLVGVGRLTHEVPDGGDWYARAAALAWNLRVESRVGWPDVHAENFSVARHAVDEIGGLPATTVELAFRLDSAGYAVRYLAAAHGVRRRDEPGRRLLAERAEDGAAHAELSSRHPAMTRGLLGWSTDGSPRELILRRAMLTLRARPAMLAALGRLVPGPGGKRAWFIFVSNFAYWDAVRRRLGADEWRRLMRGVPVLLYHAFSEHDESSRYVVTKREFARQMRVLSLLRFNVVPYGELARTMREGRLPPRTAVLTIDDGYADNGDIATAILERHGFGATIFLVTGRLGADNDWSDAAPLRGRGLLSVEQLDSLRRRGIEFGAHTRTHRSLPDADDEAIAAEVESSRIELEQALGTPVQTFAYPYGRVDARAVTAVERAGFASACTTEPRLARLHDDPLLIPRIEIKRHDSLPRFLRKVWFGGA
jgi:peptidoglycan/xylan/chitin deacetylase (PgdA/CDA1 family)